MKNVFILLLIGMYSVSSAQIINFPDPVFKTALVGFKSVDTNCDGYANAYADLNNDGEIDMDEALGIKSLNVSSRDIKDLSGIEHFENLIMLDCDFNLLTSLDVSSLNNLITLSCGFNDLTFLDVSQLINLKELRCWYNELTSLVLPESHNLIRLLSSENQLDSLDISGQKSLRDLAVYGNQLLNIDLKGLDSISEISCSDNQLTSLNVSELSNLKSLSCGLNLLTTLDVSKLDSLEFLACADNKLTSIFMKTGTRIPYINVRDNYLTLDYICCNEFEILEIKDQTKYPFSGASYCEVNSYCSFTPGGKFYTVQGENRCDIDNNGCDNLDSKIQNFKFNITNGIESGTIISSLSGEYTFPVQEDTYTITPFLEKGDYFDISPSSITVTFPSASDTFIQDFCVTPIGFYRQTNITVIPLSPPARPGFDASYKIVLENVGNQIESGTLNFRYEETLLDYITASQMPDEVADGIVKWNFTDLQPFEKREITVTLKVNKPTDIPAVNSGDKLYLTASILDNIFTLENTVIGSYDPNDKTCLQGDRVKPEMVGEYVDYLIRFENTGNYPAENVVVKDIINTEAFDVASLQITDSSHPMFSRIDSNQVEFIFENIQLPFEDDQNDGYVAFKLKSLPSLILGDSLNNIADIYFDYNFPIRTNEAQTTINNPITSINNIIETVQMYPNPVNEFLYFENKGVWKKAQIYDLSGRIVRSVSLEEKSLDVSRLGSGTYIVKLKNGSKTGVLKFVKF